MPHADSTAATLGTTTRRISRRRATSVTCRPAAPPKATSVNRRGSTPRRTETMRMPSAMLVLTTLEMPSAAAMALVPNWRAIALDRRLRRARVERNAPAEEVPRIEEAEDHVGVGDGRRGAAPAVAGGPRVGARALRSDVQDLAGHARDGAPAGAQRVDVERGERDLRDAHPLLPGELRLAVLQERDVGAGAPHVEGDQVALAEQAGRIRAGGHAARGARQHGAGGDAARLGDRRHAAVRLHDHHVTGVPRVLQLPAQARQIRATGPAPRRR